jgi:hypothetical protein
VIYQTLNPRGTTDWGVSPFQEGVWEILSHAISSRSNILTTRELLTPCLRMVQLLGAPQDVPFFGKLLQREIIYRLLQGPQGDRLRSVATMADQSYLTAKAVTWLRKKLRGGSVQRQTGSYRSQPPGR